MKDTKVRDQKVFVKLSAVTRIQENYQRLASLVKTGKAEGRDVSITATVLRGMGNVIKELELPIDFS